MELRLKLKPGVGLRFELEVSQWPWAIEPENRFVVDRGLVFE